jgi:hypothetical protein
MGEEVFRKHLLAVPFMILSTKGNKIAKSMIKMWTHHTPVFEIARPTILDQLLPSIKTIYQ